MKIGKKYSQCGWSTRIITQCGRTGDLANFTASQHCTEEKSEPNADALFIQCGSTQTHSGLSRFQKFPNPRPSADGAPALRSSADALGGNLRRVKKETLSVRSGPSALPSSADALDPQKAKNCPVWQFFYFWRIMDAF